MSKEFDYQWKNIPDIQLEYNLDRIKDFKGFSINGIQNIIKDKICLDAGCGNGRYTYVIQKLGAKKVVSIDQSKEAIKLCKRINPEAYIYNIMELKPNPIYDYVLSWGVIHHIKNPETAFKILSNQVKPGGYLQIMVYHKTTQNIYDSGRKIWHSLSEEDKKEFSLSMMAKYNGNLHGWYDALNPKYNWSYDSDIINNWFIKYGFKKIKLTKLININMIGKKI